MTVIQQQWPTEPVSVDRRAPVRWNSGAKDGAGTSASGRSTVWFTLTRGILTEVFYPSVDRANLRRLYLVVVSDRTAFVDDGSHEHRARYVKPWIPGYHVQTPLPFKGWLLHKTLLTDSSRPVVLQHNRLRGDATSGGRLRVFVVIEPHPDNQGATNDVWVGEFKGQPALLARNSDLGLALLCSSPLVAGACAYAGSDDAVADLRAHGQLTLARRAAMSGNVQAAAEVSLNDEHEFTLALGFGNGPDDAAQQARASLEDSFVTAERRYRRGWSRRRSSRATVAGAAGRVRRVFDTSLTMVQVHQDKIRPGAMIASMGIPWGDAHGDRDAGGYHLVWTRDLVESAGAMLAAGHTVGPRQTLAYLISTQEADGVWPQNMWLDGTPCLRGIQLDEVALPILLAAMLSRADVLAEIDPWPMVRAAAGYIVRVGPVTPQDRWEEEGGYSPYTIAAMIAALLDAAVFAERAHERTLAAHFREMADAWFDSLDRWTYVRETALAKRYGVDGYYVRLTPRAAVSDGSAAKLGTPMPLLNQPNREATRPFEDVVSPDALALVRFGLRSGDDPRIRNTVKVIDGELRTRTRRGFAWHRYTDDGYGETADGGPHLGIGIGRAWPLLTGERAHYEVARGRLDVAERLLRTMAAQASRTGLLPEQIWEATDIPERGLCNGRPTGSAMPLVWAHAELLKLCRSVKDGRVFDMPPEPARRYADQGDAPSPETSA